MTLSSILTCLGIGSLAGVIAALCGVGGGVIMVPCFVMMLGMDQKNAVATSLMAMIGMSISTSFLNQRQGLGNWQFAAVATIGAVITSAYATGYLKTISNERLTQFFGTLLVVMGARMLLMGKA